MDVIAEFERDQCRRAGVPEAVAMVPHRVREWFMGRGTIGLADALELLAAGKFGIAGLLWCDAPRRREDDEGDYDVACGKCCGCNALLEAWNEQLLESPVNATRAGSVE
jgi:hypothetical protein